MSLVNVNKFLCSELDDFLLDGINRSRKWSKMTQNVFRTLPNIFDKAFFWKLLTVKVVSYFCQKTPLYIFDRVLNTPLIPVDTGRKLNVLCTFNLRPVSTEMTVTKISEK